MTGVDGVVGAGCAGVPVWADALEEMERRRGFAEAMGGVDKVERQHVAGRLTARERIGVLVDPGSFVEIGMFTGKGTYDERGALVSVVPANVIIGTGRVEGREIVVVAEDFTVRGGSSEATSPEKWQYGERLALEYRLPIVRLVETAGGSINLLEQAQATKIPGYPHWPWMDLLGVVPVIGVALGACAGLGALRVVASHFSVMPKGTSQVFAGGPAVVAPGVGESVSKDALGGSSVHAHGSGVVDNEAEDERDALAQVRRFLSYLPSNVYDLPARTDCVDNPDRREEFLASVVPKEKRRAYPMRQVLEAVFDRESLFEVGRYQGRSLIAMLGRLNGLPVGVVGNDPFFNGGALTAEAAEKLIRFVDMCDSFHLPIVNFVDQPGTYVGSTAEARGTVRLGVRAALMLEQVSSPWCAVFVRRAFGLAGGAFGPQTHGLTFRYAWPSAYWGSIPIEGGVEAAYKRDIAAAPDPEARRAELIEHFKPLESPFRTAERFGIQDIIDPRDTRPILCAWVESAYRLVPQLLGIKTRSMRC